MVVLSKMRILIVSHSLPFLLSISMLFNKLCWYLLYNISSVSHWTGSCQHGKCRSQHKWESVFYMHCQGIFLFFITPSHTRGLNYKYAFFLTLWFLPLKNSHASCATMHVKWASSPLSPTFAYFSVQHRK